MRCARVQERLVLYLAGELTPKENDCLSSHLARCAVCATLAEDLTATQERLAVGLNLNVEPPATLDAFVMAAIRALPVRQPSWRRFPPNWGRIPRYALAACLCCMVILSMAIGSVVGGYYRQKPALELASLGRAHSQRLAALSFPQLRGSDAQQLTRELTPLVAFQVRAANLQSEGALLVGGSRTIVDNVAVAALHYNWEGHCNFPVRDGWSQFGSFATAPDGTRTRRLLRPQGRKSGLRGVAFRQDRLRDGGGGCSYAPIVPSRLPRLRAAGVISRNGSFLIKFEARNTLLAE